MAVLAAVRGWESFAGLPSLNERDGASEDKPEDTQVKVDAEEEEEIDEDDWTAEELDGGLDGLLESDYVSLLLAHDEHIQAPPPVVPIRQ